MANMFYGKHLLDKICLLEGIWKYTLKFKSFAFFSTLSYLSLVVNQIKRVQLLQTTRKKDAKAFRTRKATFSRNYAEFLIQMVFSPGPRTVIDDSEITFTQLGLD